MTPRAYYNEWDKDAAAWLRELIAAGLIMAGDVDERNISDVRPTDLAGYAQCHFFGGISGWPLALQLAGWPDDHPCWSGSCPCQPFSSAGKRTGITDCRHLWPEFKRLIAACCPSFVFGEQVASSEVVGSQLEAAFLVAVQEGKIARANRLAKRLAASKGFHFHPRWLDGVRADLEAEGYAFRFMVLGAHSVGAPHIRQRVYWLAQSASPRHDDAGQHRSGPSPLPARPVECGGTGGLADAERAQRGQAGRAGLDELDGADAGGGQAASGPGLRGEPGGLGNAPAGGWGIGGHEAQPGSGGHALGTGGAGLGGLGNADPQRHKEPESSDASAGRLSQRQFVTPVDCIGGPWSDCVFIPCRDGKVRRVGRRIRPLAARIPRDVAALMPRLEKLGHDPTAARRIIREARRHRVVALRGAGNSIVPPLAAEFIRAAMAAEKEEPA